MKVFLPNETKFNTNGLGFITPIKCIEKKIKSLNGWSIDAEVSSEYSTLIKQDYIAFVETKEKGGQPFRIMNVTRENRVISFTANHVVFDAERYLLDDVRPTNATALSYLQYINGKTDTKSPFFVSSNIMIKGTNYFIRKTLLEAFEKAEETFHGIYDINGFSVELKDKIGNDNGLTVKYGKDILGVNITEDWSAVCTKILPEGPDGLLLPEKYLKSQTQYEKPYTRTIKFDMSKKKDDDTDKTESELIVELRNKAKDYIEENQYPKINYLITVDPDYECCIGDTIHIKHPLVEINAEVQSYEYDVISRRLKTLEFGNYHRDVKKVFDKIKQKVDESIDASTINKWMIEHQTDLINSQHKNGYVYIDENEIFILDKLPKEKAKNVWRWNMGGLGFSSNGFQGPFETAITNDGKINAKFILTGILQAIKIQGCEFTNGLNFYVDSDGNMQCFNGKFSGSITASEININNLFKVLKNGSMQCLDGKFSGTITASEINSNDKFKVSKEGKLIAENAEIKGTIKGSRITGSSFSADNENYELNISGGSLILYKIVKKENAKFYYTSLSVGDNQIRFFDWNDLGNYVGSIGATHEMETNRSVLSIWCDQGDRLVIGCKRSDGKIDPVIAIDDNTHNTATPYIRNTANGTLKLCNGTITIENGLIKDWSIPGAMTGYFYAQDGTKINVQNGIITGLG